MGHREHREIRFVLLAAQPVIAAVDTGGMLELIRKGLDWDQVLELAGRESVVPLVYRNLHAHFATQVPPDVLDRCERFYSANTRRNRMLADVLLQIGADCTAAGIDLLSYKGPEMAQNLYGDIGLRKFKDIDFLVRPEQVSAMVATLEGEGYRRKYDLTPAQDAHFRRAFKEYSCQGPNRLAAQDEGRFEPYWDDLLARKLETVRYYGPIVVEPHWSLTTGRYPLTIEYDGLWERARAVPLAGGAVNTFAPEDLLNVLCINGCKSRWKQLQLVCDVAAALGSFKELDWASACERAESWGSLRMLLLGCALAHELFGTPLPLRIAHRIQADPSVRALVRRFRAAICGERHGLRLLPKQFSLLFYHMRERPRDKLLYLLRTISTPRVDHFRRVPLPDRVFFLYYLVAPVYDYLFMPVWRMVKLLGARLARPFEHPQTADHAH